MSSELAGGSEFTEFVSNHVLTDIDGDVDAAVVHRDCVSDHGRHDGGSA